MAKKLHFGPDLEKIKDLEKMKDKDIYVFSKKEITVCMIYCTDTCMFWTKF